MISTTACFTGYRESKMPFHYSDTEKISVLKSNIERTVRKLSVDIDTYMCGMCDGADIWAAQVILSLRAELGHRLVCVVPFEEHKRYVPLHCRNAYDELLAKADEIHTLMSRSSCVSEAFMKRNMYMLERSETVIAICPETNILTGGTKSTVSRARSMSKQIYFIDPFITHEDKERKPN